MGKYDSLRKSQVPRHSAHALTPGLSYVPTVCRSVLQEDGSDTQAEQDPWVDFSMDAMDAMDAADEEIDEPLPVPDLEEDTRIVPRTTAIQPIGSASAQMRPIQCTTQIKTRSPVAPRVQALLSDPLAMLEAATIRNVPKRR